jgi:hypothetical protein
MIPGPAAAGEHAVRQQPAAPPLLVLRIVAVLGVAAAALAGCGSSQPPAIPGVVRVVAGENFWGDIAA